jgi:putative ATP-dependent endonuclease of OLD family
MIADSIKFRGHRCFKNDWAGFDTVLPVNVIIGRNNSGKSHLLDLVEWLCSPSLQTTQKHDWRFRCTGILDAESLKRYFPLNTSGGNLGGDHWEAHGRLFVDTTVSWELDGQWTPSNIEFLSALPPETPLSERSKTGRGERLSQVLKSVFHKLCGSSFKGLLAERNIGPEKKSNDMSLGQNGQGATNIIRRYIVTSSPKYPREIVQQCLLEGLNTIFGNDGHFTELQVKEHDEPGTGISADHWEVFLGEAKKGGLISLSNSGSGLKTVMLVLLNLLVVPEIEGKAKSGYTFAFEELENNLHPALLRRLFHYLEDYAVREKATIFLTTHSSTALDIFGISKNAQIIHVTHDGESARATTISAHFDRLGVVSELGAKPSDLLQANGIIWVEGPSDRIYLNWWVNLFSGGKLQEGRDYQCAFYGGSLLARTQFKSPEEAEAELVNLLHVNPHIVIVCDGDRTAADGEGSDIKPRVQRIKDEVSKLPDGHIWITAAKEIENYLPGSVLSAVFNLPEVTDPSQYERFFPSDDTAKSGSSFVESHLKRKTVDKMELAVQAAPHMTTEMMALRFDLGDQMMQIITRIQKWNA